MTRLLQDKGRYFKARETVDDAEFYGKMKTVYNKSGYTLLGDETYANDEFVTTLLCCRRNYRN